MDTPGTVHVIARWQAAPDRLEAVRGLLGRLAAASLAEPGCLAFEVLESADQPGDFVLVERYAGAAGRRAHLDSAHFHDLVLARAVPLLAHREVGTYRELRQP